MEAKDTKTLTNTTVFCEYTEHRKERKDQKPLQEKKVPTLSVGCSRPSPNTEWYPEHLKCRPSQKRAQEFKQTKRSSTTSEACPITMIG